MKIQIFQHLPTLPKAGIFRPLPILCVAFRAFIPDRSVFRCSPLPCLSMFCPLVPMHKSAHPVTHSAAPPNHACAPHTPITPVTVQSSPHTSTRRRTSRTGYHPPASGAAHRPPPPYSHHSPTPHSHAVHANHTVPRTPTPAVPLPAQATRRQRQMGQHTHSRHCTAITPPHCTPTPHMPITPQSSQQIGASALATTIQLPPPHTQASKKDCPAQEQSFL